MKDIAAAITTSARLAAQAKLATAATDLGVKTAAATAAAAELQNTIDIESVIGSGTSSILAAQIARAAATVVDLAAKTALANTGAQSTSALKTSTAATWSAATVTWG